MARVIVLLAVLALAALGAAGVVYGEADDSPGLQLIGVVLVVGSVIAAVKAFRHSR